MPWLAVGLDDLDVFCAVLDCTPAELLLHEPSQARARRDELKQVANADAAPVGSPVVPRLGRNRSLPPA
ncbi:helix-turn-helix domain-containing protein [Micromonospora sp. NPDC092111]|uniref:helix-turn-helix domain-containing protein n=1 Tax=Micromonospora sp. NPDC092111 TaxID=3364289 RepID=UPI0038001016